MIQTKLIRKIGLGQAILHEIEVELQPVEKHPPGVQSVVLVYGRTRMTVDNDWQIVTDYTYQGTRIKFYG